MQKTCSVLLLIAARPVLRAVVFPRSHLAGSDGNDCKLGFLELGMAFVAEFPRALSARQFTIGVPVLTMRWRNAVLVLLSLGLAGCPPDTAMYLYNNYDESVQLVLLERTVTVPPGTSITIGTRSGTVDLSDLPWGGDPLTRSWPILKVRSGSASHSHDLHFDESAADYVQPSRQRREMWLQLDSPDSLFLIRPGTAIPTSDRAVKMAVR